MSYNGSGTFQINTTGQPVVTGTVISSSAFNSLTADLATGLSTAITKDGQTTTTARIPFAAGINSTLVTDSSSVSTGSIITAGGVGIAKNLYVGVNANVAGTLGVTGVATFSAAPIYSSLTASSAVATDASKALVSVTNTGTGSNVLATSPTISLPVIDNIKMGYTTTATAAGTTTLTVASNYRQFFTGSTTQTVVLPVTSTLVTGMAYEIENNSTGTLTVNSSGGNLVGTIPAGVCAHAVCIATSTTTAADWDWDYISTATITGTGANVLGTSPTLTTPIVTTTMGVGNATPAASGAGITFPAAVNASSDVNTLDDYEEGVWTPAMTNLTINSGTPTFSGTYTKIGRLVLVSWVIAGTRNITVTADSTFINNLPFTSAITTLGGWGKTGTLNLFNGTITSGINLYFTNTLTSTTEGLSGSVVYTV